MREKFASMWKNLVFNDTRYSQSYAEPGLNVHTRCVLCESKTLKISLSKVSTMGTRTHRIKEAYYMLPSIALTTIELLELGHLYM